MAFHLVMQALLDRSDVVSFLELAARCDLKAYIEWKHRNCNPAPMLDQLALGWRTPCHVWRVEVTDFEIRRLADQDLASWRLEVYVEVLKDSETAHEAFEKTDQLSHLHIDDDRVDGDQVMIREKRRRRLLKRFKAALH